MGSDKAIKVVLAVLLALTSLTLVSLLIILDTTIATNQSLGARVTWLEDKMIEKVKPVIQVNRATIYNTEGEIVLETNEDKK